MNDSLSDENKRFFHSTIFGYRSISPTWILIQLSLVVSSIAVLRKLLLRVYPKSVFIVQESVNEPGEIVGVAFIKVKEGNAKTGFVGELGICVREDHQGRGVGFALMNRLLEWAKRENVGKVFLTVLADNIRAVNLYKKFGFKKVRVVKEGDVWNGNRFESIEMYLSLQESSTFSSKAF